MKVKTIAVPVLAMFLVIAGCSTSVRVDGTFPAPVTQPLPVRAGLLLDQDFRSHIHESDYSRKITFTVGGAQSALFEQASTGLFSHITILDSLPEDNPALDLILVPTVTDIQLATPDETQFNVFEVWLQYNIRVLSGGGDPITDWRLTAYGKTPTRFLRSRGEALNQAAIVALRDAGARLVIELPREPAVQDWLEQNLASDPSTQQPAPEEES